MAIKTDIRGMVYKYEDGYVIGREKVREYAKAVKAEDPASYDDAAAAELGHDGLLAPLTFVQPGFGVVRRSLDAGGNERML